MTDTIEPPDGYGRPADQERSRPGSLDPARRLRMLTGVDERLLAWVWHERSQYTALGAVVLGTSVIAAFSMWNFANEAIGEASLLALVPALIWMMFVLNLDRWLVAPRPNTKRRVSPLLARLLIALVLGAVVAEPLVLRVFQTAVEERIREERHADVDRLRGELVRCNPDPSQPAADRDAAECGDRSLSFGATPAADSAALATLRKDAGELRTRVNRESDKLEKLNIEVRAECAGLIRNAATGLLQRTSECLRLRATTADYIATHHTAENEERLAALDERITRDGGRLTSSRSMYLAARDKAISQRVAQEQAKQRGIGFLERMSALEELTGKNTTLLVGVWMVRLLFVLIDVLPVLVKFMSGENSYDRLLTARSNSSVKIHEALVRTAEYKAMTESEIKREEYEQNVRKRKAEVDADRREHVAAMSIRVSQAVNTLEDELRRTAPARTGR